MLGGECIFLGFSTAHVEKSRNSSKFSMREMSMSITGMVKIVGASDEREVP